LADQRVARLPSTALAGRFPSWVLEVTAAPPGVISTSPPAGVVGVGVGVGGTGVAGVFVGVGVGITGVGVGVGVNTLIPKTLTSVTLFMVALVLPMLPWPRYRTQRAWTSAKS
jgi:hypothetical protein